MKGWGGAGDIRDEYGACDLCRRCYVRKVAHCESVRLKAEGDGRWRAQKALLTTHRRCASVEEISSEAAASLMLGSSKAVWWPQLAYASPADPSDAWNRVVLKDVQLRDE